MTDPIEGLAESVGCELRNTNPSVLLKALMGQFGGPEGLAGVIHKEFSALPAGDPGRGRILGAMMALMGKYGDTEDDLSESQEELQQELDQMDGESDK